MSINHNATAPSAGSRLSPLHSLDYSVVQQCMHCGLCLPTCPTYDVTKLERNSPRGRIALMRSIADGRLEATRTFADEMYFCLGCLACMTACPAGVNYAELFEHARAEAEARSLRIGHVPVTSKSALVRPSSIVSHPVEETAPPVAPASSSPDSVCLKA